MIVGRIETEEEEAEAEDLDETQRDDKLSYTHFGLPFIIWAQQQQHQLQQDAHYVIILNRRRLLDEPCDWFGYDDKK